MQTLALAPVPNQEFTTTLDGNLYDIAVYVAAGTMCYDISVNGTPLLTGQRITPGFFLIAYGAYEGQTGNLMLLTNNFALPDYTLFGTSQTLIYMTLAEIEAAIAAAPTPGLQPSFAVVS